MATGAGAGVTEILQFRPCPRFWNSRRIADIVHLRLDEFLFVLWFRTDGGQTFFFRIENEIVKISMIVWRYMAVRIGTYRSGRRWSWLRWQFSMSSRGWCPTVDTNCPCPSRFGRRDRPASRPTPGTFPQEWWQRRRRSRPRQHPGKCTSYCLVPDSKFCPCIRLAGMVSPMRKYTCPAKFHNLFY